MCAVWYYPDVSDARHYIKDTQANLRVPWRRCRNVDTSIGPSLRLLALCVVMFSPLSTGKGPITADSYLMLMDACTE